MNESITNYDCFNGDADGICALLQLRKQQPRDAELVTGIKRDIALLKKVKPEAGDKITALDISFDKNRDDVMRVLEAGAEVFYCDHHFAGDIPEHPHLTTLINLAPDVCTSLLINGHLNSAYAPWAMVGASGDNLIKSAQALAKQHHVSEADFAAMQSLGIYINYNGYGASLDDLHFHPDALYRLLYNYDKPLDFMRDDKTNFEKLEQGYYQDMAKAEQSTSLKVTDSIAVLRLPDEAWARRVSGVYGNDLANKHPHRSHAIVTEKANGDYLVSVRAPLNNKTGADQLCRQFDTGGGRAAAAGINALPEAELPKFMDAFERLYQAT